MASRYGGTHAPCDDPAPCEVGPRTGLRIKTRLGPSAIDGAGLGRFAEEARGSPATVMLSQHAVLSWGDMDVDASAI